MSSAIQLIVGLGNPGKLYANTRHNAGAWFVAHLTEKHAVPIKLENKFQALFGTLTTEFGECKLVLPQTYMNQSGISVQKVASYYKIATDNILVVHDDLDFSVGILRLKLGGGHGGHNGLRNIAEQLSSPNFWRLRIGISRPKESSQVHDYVLAAPSQQDKILIQDEIVQAASLLPEFLCGNFDKAQRLLINYK